MKEQKLVPFGWADRGNYIKNIWMNYRLTLEGFNKLWKEQEGKCAGCTGIFAHPINKELRELALKPEVDHDHATMKVRGLLCRSCNDLLGRVQDDHERMLRLVEYLKKHGDIA